MTDAIGRLSSALADRYRIERELGRGGMATVYLAEDVRHHRLWDRARAISQWLAADHPRNGTFAAHRATMLLNGYGDTAGARAQVRPGRRGGRVL